MVLAAPTSYTAAPGNFLTSALWNAQVRDSNAFFAGVPVFSGYQSVAQPINGSNNWAPLLIDSETIDNYGGHSTTTNTSRYTVQLAGTYQVFGSVAWTASSTGDRRLQITQNGASVLGSASSFDPSQVVLCAQQTMCIVPAAVGDYFEIQACHTATTSPTTFNTNAGSGGSAMFTSSMRVLWIGN
jgi:hypothetical protein